MSSRFYGPIFLFVAIIVADQTIKTLFVEGFRFSSSCIDLTLTYNKGVAFSMFAFLEEYLKYLQIALLAGIALYVYQTKPIAYAYPIALFMGAGVSNIYDRFIHGGVVDYVYWHCGFDFAIFNLADVGIDMAVVWIFWMAYREHKGQSSCKEKK